MQSPITILVSTSPSCLLFISLVFFFCTHCRGFAFTHTLVKLAKYVMLIETCHCMRPISLVPPVSEICSNSIGFSVAHNSFQIVNPSHFDVGLVPKSSRSGFVFARELFAFSSNLQSSIVYDDTFASCFRVECKMTSEVTNPSTAQILTYGLRI